MKVKLITKRKSDGALIYAKQGCKKCYGRGFVGLCNHRTIPCSCVFAVPTQPTIQDNKPEKKKNIIIRFFQWIKKSLTKKTFYIPISKIHHVR